MENCNYCEKNRSKCGAECCSLTLPLSQEEIDLIKSYIYENNIFANNYNKNQNALDPTFYNACPFLSTSLKCNIYSVRPEICRKFTCQHILKNFNHSGKRIVNMLKEFFPEEKLLFSPDVDEINKQYQEKKKKAGIKV